MIVDFKTPSNKPREEAGKKTSSDQTGVNLSGVKKWNIQEIHDHTGIRVFHTTGRKGVLDSGMV